VAARSGDQRPIEQLAADAPACPASLDLLLHRLRPRLLAMAARQCSLYDEDREDMVQDALLRVACHIGTYDPARGATITTWARRILTNLIHNELRRSRRERARLQGYAAQADVLRTLPTGDDILDRLASGERTVSVREAVAELPTHYRVVMELAVSGATNGEIARACGVSEGTVKSRKSRAARKLRAVMSEVPEAA
jgi:RNA polymerase sigma-70 factor, ECF subfamily